MIKRKLGFASLDLRAVRGGDTKTPPPPPPTKPKVKDYDFTDPGHPLRDV